jgi:hypothetical protein
MTSSDQPPNTIDSPQEGVDKLVSDLTVKIINWHVHGEAKSANYHDEAVTDIKKWAVQEANKAVVAELKIVLQNCPMPTLSYEDIEHRIASLQANGAAQ